MLFRKFSLITLILIMVSFIVVNCDKEPAKDKAYYFEMGNKYFMEEQYENAAESFKTVINDFQGKTYRAKSLFFLGFIYANNLFKQPKELEIAEKFYNQLIKEFPAHELIQSAKVELDNLGKDPEDIIFPVKKDSVK